MKANEEIIKNEFKTVATDLSYRWKNSKDKRLLLVAEELRTATQEYKDNNLDKSLEILEGAKEMLMESSRFCKCGGLKMDESEFCKDCI